VVEVLSPGDRPNVTLAKVAEWLKAGSRLVWVVDPNRRVVHVYRQDGSEALIAEARVLSGEDVVPGFEGRLGEIMGARL
jgi:Uma2 family endonuclease